MDELERQIGAEMAEAVKTLPQAERQYFIGYARGVADMAKKQKAAQGEKCPA